MPSLQNSGWSLPASTSRRTFRGRGRQKDGNLPRPKTRINREHENANTKKKYDDEKFEPNRASIGKVEEPIDSDTTEGVKDPIASGDSNEGKDEGGSEELKAFLSETTHLRQRMKNIRESIATSTNLSNISVWNQNCLNAVRNCAQIWISIINMYGTTSTYNIICDEEATTKTIASNLFQLIQMSVQCGPLAGSKPGYFKRCGGQAANLATIYLGRLWPDLEKMLFTEKQIRCISKWRSDAEIAVKRNAPVSKSVSKLQNSGKK